MKIISTTLGGGYEVLYINIYMDVYICINFLLALSQTPNIDKALIGFKVTVINDKKGVFHL